MKLGKFMGLFLIAGLWLIHSCDFDTDELSFLDVVIPEPEYPVVWLDFGDSVITIYEDCTFHYAVQLDHQVHLLTEVYIDEDLIHSDTGSIGAFTTHLHDGNHKMEMHIYTSSASGSIREVLGGETNVFSSSWLLIKERPDSYSGINFLWSDIVNGRFKAQWEPYQDYRFQYYHIRSEKPWYSLRVEDVNQTQISDPYFVGGSLTYYLDVMTTDNVQIACDTLSFSSFNELNYSMDNELNLTLSWYKCPFPSNFKSYSLAKYLNDRVIEYQTMGINDTSFTFPYGLFPELTFQVTTEANETQNGAGIYEFEGVVRTGESIHSYRAISRSMFPPYRIYTDKQIFDPVENTVSSYEIPAPSDQLQISPDNEVLASETHWQDPNQPGIWHELKGLPEEFGNQVSKRISLSGNQLGIFESDESFLVYDFRNDSVAVPWRNGGLRWREFSPNGEYYLGLQFQEINICAPKGNDWEIISTLSDYEIGYYNGYYPYLFLPEQEQSDFVFLVGDKLVLWSCDRKELIAEVPCSARVLLDLDPQTSTLLCAEGSEKLYVYSLPDLTLLKEIDISGDLESRQNYSKTNLAYSCGKLYIKYKTSNAYEFQLLNIR